MCSERNSVTAYRIKEKTILTAVSSDVLPNGFPKDFSIVAVIRSRRSARNSLPLFSLYSQSSERVLSLMVVNHIKLYYQDTDGTAIRNTIVSFAIGFADESSWYIMSSTNWRVCQPATLLFLTMSKIIELIGDEDYEEKFRTLNIPATLTEDILDLKDGFEHTAHHTELLGYYVRMYEQDMLEEEEEEAGN